MIRQIDGSEDLDQPYEDMDDEYDERDARAEVARLIRGRGLRVAVNAAIEVAGDSKAPAPARATAAGLLMRVAGLFAKPIQESDDETPLEELSAAELSRLIHRIKREYDREDRLAALDREALANSLAEAGGDLFG